MSFYTSGKARQSLIDTVAFRAVSQTATILSYVVMVRGMSKEDFGVFYLLYTFIPVISTFASLGLEQTLRRYQPEYLSSGNKSAAIWLVKFVASARFASNLVLLGLLLLTWNYFAPIFKLVPYRVQFAILGLIVLLHFQARVLQLSLASHMLQRYSVGSIAVFSTVKLTVYCMLAWFESFTLTYAIVADAFAYAVMYTLLRVAYRRNCLSDPIAASYSPRPTERKRLFWYGLYNNFNDAGSFALSFKADNFFLAVFFDPISVGIYAFYVQLNHMAAKLMPLRLFDNVVQPMFFSIPQSEADRQLPRFFTLLVNTSLLVQWPMLAYTVAYHAEIVEVIFGGKFIENSWLLPLVVAFSTLNVIGTPSTLAAQYEEKAAIILFSKIAVIYNVLALLVLIPIAGLYGAAIATGSANFLKNLFIWWHVRERAKWMNLGAVLVNGVMIWGAVVAVCYALKSWLLAPSIAHLGLGIVVCAVATLVYVRSQAISSSDRSILESIMRGKALQLIRWVGLLRRPARGNRSGAG